MDVPNTSPRPLMPPPPDGVSTGRVGVNYAFAVSTRDPLGDYVSCRFSWGDGQQSDWTSPRPGGQPHALTHRWEKPGKYDVCAQARNTSGSMTLWGPAMRVTVLEKDRESTAEFV